MPLSGAIQRRGFGGRAGTESTLPMTSADTTQAAAATSSVRRRRKGSGGKTNRVLLVQIILVATVVLVLFTVYAFQKTPSGAGDDGDSEVVAQHAQRHVQTSDGGTLPLAKFSSLSYALANTNLVALYYAASWCPMSTPVTKELESTFSQKAGALLVPGDEASGEDVHRPLAIVYVSSDTSDDEMQQYSRKGWINVPFDSPDRNGLKRHFRVCAKRELQELGFDRKMEIPSIIIIDSVTQGVLTTSGVSDLKEYGDKAIDHWMGLQQLIRALEDKYENEESERERQRKPESRIV